MKKKDSVHRIRRTLKRNLKGDLKLIDILKIIYADIWNSSAPISLEDVRKREDAIKLFENTIEHLMHLINNEKKRLDHYRARFEAEEDYFRGIGGEKV